MNYIKMHEFMRFLATVGILCAIISMIGDVFLHNYIGIIGDLIMFEINIWLWKRV